MNFRHWLAYAFVTGTIVANGVAVADTITVDATDDIFLAGLTSVPTDFPVDPATGGLGAGTLPASLTVFPGESLTLTATGVVSCCFGGVPKNGPDGKTDGPTNIPGYGNVAGYARSQFHGAGWRVQWTWTCGD